MSKILKNQGGADIVLDDVGVTVSAGTDYTIPPQDYPAFSASGDTIKALANESLKFNDGSFDFPITELSRAVDILKGWPVQEVPTDETEFFFDFTGVISGDDPQTILEQTVDPLVNIELQRIYLACRREAVLQVYLDGTEIAKLVTGPGKPTDSFDFKPNKICAGSSTLLAQLQKRVGIPDTDASVHFMGLQTS